MSKYAELWDDKIDLMGESDKNTPWFKMIQWMPKNQRVLDVGCSSGYFGEKLIAIKNDIVWGLELDRSDAAAARKRGYQKVFEGDLDAFKWSQLDGLVFDAIIFADILEHIKDPLSCLISASKFLAKNGSIFCSIPNIANMTVRTELMEGNFDYEATGLLDNTHIHFFTKKTVFNTLAAAGLQIVRLDGTINDYSDGHIKAHLSKLGLVPNKTFDSLLGSAEARTFQFILEAKKTDGKPLTPPEYTVPAKLNDDWPKIAKKMDDDDARIKELEHVNQTLAQRLQKAEEKLAGIYQHPLSWLMKAALGRVSDHGRRRK